MIKSEFVIDQKTIFRSPPILEVTRFASKSYSGVTLKEKISYQHGKLEEPNIFSISEKYDWQSFDPSRKIKKVTGKKLIAQFDADTLLETIAGSEIKEIELKQGFVFSAKDFDIKSDEATFYAKDNILLGTDPVYMTGLDTRIHSSDGFKVELKKGDFELFGNVNGVIEDGEIFK